MNTPTQALSTRVELKSGDAYRESLRGYSPKVFVDGREVASAVDEPALRPGVNALAFTCDFALSPECAPIALATQASRHRVVPRMLHVNESAGDLLNKLEAVRVLCLETGCAQRYLAHVQDNDLSLGIAMTDAKGDRIKKPHEQANPDSYVHIVGRTAKGIVISGTKAIVTGAAYMHEFLVMPSHKCCRPRPTSCMKSASRRLDSSRT